MLDVLAEYAGISLKQPPDEVFRHLQRLHGLPEVGGPPERDPRAALGRVEDRQGQLLAQGGRLADQAAWTVAYPRLFHEDDNECQHALSQAVAGFRLAARAAL